MYSEKILDDIHIIFPYQRKYEYYIVINNQTQAKFIFNRTLKFEDEIMVMYIDSYGNLMSNNKNLKVTIDKSETVQFKKYRQQVILSNNLTVTILPMKDIQEIANNTFYLDHQRHIVDFVNLIIKEGNNILPLFFV
jgi:co-chaperonin GroES (HSP10)